jgi:hypothetical protein
MTAARPHVRLRRFAPYLIAATVVAFLLHKYPGSDIVAEMRLGHALRMVPFATALPFVLWVPYAIYDRVVLSNAIAPIPLRDVLRARAASTVLLTLGYFFGGGGYAVWIARKMRSGPARAAGAVLYVVSSDLVSVCAVAAASMWFGGLSVSPALRNVATAILAVQTLLILVGPHLHSWRANEDSPGTLTIFEPWRTVPRGLGFAQIAGRCANIAVITAFVWGGARAFGIDIPLRAMGMYMPIILLVGSLPFTVAGFGAVQAAWLLLLPWSNGPQILAFQFLWQLFRAMGVLLLGLPFVRSVVAEIDS